MGLKRTARLDPGGNRIALLLLRIIQQYFVFFSLKNGRRVVEGLRRKRERERERTRKRREKKDIQLLLSAVGFVVWWQLLTSR